MGVNGAVGLCLAYIVGLLFTAVPWGGWILLAAGVGLAIAARYWRNFPLKPGFWVAAGIIGLVAGLYFQLRLPQPRPTDISHLLTPTDPSLEVVVEGAVTSLPHLTRSEKAQFWLKPQRVAPVGDGKAFTGNLYTTVPMAQATNLHPGQRVRVGGVLYLPGTATNPGGFDFKEYLRQAGSFAGLRGEQVQILQDSSSWGWWQIQQRIGQVQQQGLGSPEGPLVSAMVLGSKAVDLPAQVKDEFVRAGLAHALAASGFQTSLILGVVLALTRRSSERIQFVAGTLALAGFVGLAGTQPAVLRAALMGFGGLVALVMNRKLKPLGSLLLTATILLAIAPFWIWDVGFQLSFLATIGLLVTVPPLTQRLDWLPGAIAPFLAVPIAAYLWTLPLQLGAFGVLSPYSIPVNLITTPFISLISLGGMVSALMALVWAPAGSALAWLLKYPTQGLLAIVHGAAQLPGSAYALGTLPVLVVIALYGLLILSTVHAWWQRRWWIALATGLGLLVAVVWAGNCLTQVTVLATAKEPVMVIRDRGRAELVNSGSSQTVQFTLLPFLQQRGVNQIDWAIAPAPDGFTNGGWAELTQRLPVKHFFKHPGLAIAHGLKATDRPLPINQSVQYGAVQVNLLQEQPAIAHLTIHQQSWLWLGAIQPEQQENLLRTTSLPRSEVLWWSGKSLRPELLEQVRPRVAIASSKSVAPDMAAYLQQHQIHLYCTGRDGAIQWTPQDGFRPALDAEGSPAI